jgi:anti-sigma regulatory factor (Ser/Thr protein kinase)
MMRAPMTQMESHTSGGLHHAVLFYHSDAEFGTAVADFVHAGVAAGEAVLVAAPESRLDEVRVRLNGPGDAVSFVDAMGVGANPARLIPVYRQFIDAHPGRRLRLTGELLWPGRTAGEVAEIVRHEALVNLALAGAPISVCCVYDARVVDGAVLAAVERTHPVLIRDGSRHASEHYAGPGLPPSCDQPLPSPPADAALLGFDDVNDLPAVRRHVRGYAARIGLPAARIGDLVVAVNELVGNACVHGGGRGVCRIWHDGASGTLTCEVAGPGHIADPLAGRRLVPVSAGCGHGLWLVNQLCDLVELRSQAAGTIVRVHMRLHGNLVRLGWRSPARRPAARAPSAERTVRGLVSWCLNTRLGIQEAR